MSTDLSSASVPQFYRQLFDACSNDGQPILSEVYQNLLTKCKLSTAQIEKIYNLIKPSSEGINRTNFYKTLALIAWSQQGKQLSDKLFENCTEKEYPTPEINDVAQMRNLKIQLYKKQGLNTFSYCSIIKRDSINVHLVPEKKGLILKYSEYIVTSERFNTKVTRRYNDFVALKELLLNRFPYRLVPSLPPKKIVSDAHFLESRRRALQRWLTLVCRHPVISQDPIMIFFLIDQGPDFQHRIKDVFGRVPDEFTTSDIAATAKELLPPEYSQMAVNSQNIRTLVNVIGKMKHLTEENVERCNSSGRDFDELINQIKILSTLNIERAQNSIENWGDMQKGFDIMSREMPILSNKLNQHGYLQQNEVCERLGLLLDILVAHKDLCERLEKGLHHDHAAALSKLLSMKKRKIQGVIRGTDAESVEHLESKMLTQENVITNMELRADFSLYCVHMETQLVYAYLETLADIMKNLMNLQIKSHFELHDIWNRVQTSVQPFFRCDNVNGDVLNNN
ncbi:sorting nexin-8-like [Diorhabda carinulata]|uniref:sorting nexin-8-like n=1 Tax=Diorhabda carinulata TaxID=1163345 RepID=UPI0025A30FCE|nr:sorting nexin-8-like [Diorhabda carinulata]XP_057667043.1 sorting nexin-8-like [Diorhabda carinulata]